MLICGAGALAGVGGWLLGDQWFFQRASASLTPDETALVAQYPVPNTTTKQDRVMSSRSDAAVDIGPASQTIETARAWLAAPITLPRTAAAKSEKPSRLFLNDTQIAGIKKRLKLTAAQQKYWAPVENALREVTLQIEDYQKRLKRRDDSFDTDSAEIQRLKAASKALYAQLRGDQKNEISVLVRMAGLGPVFAELTGTKPAKNEPENSR